MRASMAVARAWRTSPACNAAAPSAPRMPVSLVFTWPGTGALAKTATRIASGRSPLDVITTGEALRRHAHGVREANSPHEDDGASHAVAFPAARRGDRMAANAERPRKRLQPLRDLHVFHQGNFGKAV